MSFRYDSTCSNCGVQNDAQSSVDDDDDARPEDGSLSICVYCGHIMAFVVKRGKIERLRELKPRESKKVQGDPDIQRILAIREKVMTDDDRP